MNEPHDTAVLISINPYWCQLIASGKKTIEVRKTRPQIKTPFKCYIYCTKDKGNSGPATHFFESDDGTFYSAGKTFSAFLSGTVIGEFVCDYIEHYVTLYTPNYATLYMKEEYGEVISSIDFGATCLTEDDFFAYGKRNDLFGWHISNLRIYDHPKKLSDFSKPCPNKKICIFCDHHYTETTENDGRCIDPGCCSYYEMDESKIKRAPQSWSYIEEV